MNEPDGMALALQRESWGGKEAEEMVATKDSVAKRSSVSENHGFCSAWMPTSESEKTTARLYRVQSGDTLVSIARKFYGSERIWGELYRANHEVLIGAKGVTPGLVIHLPDLETDILTRVER